ncbi:unnamed protein product, partial [Amoebophrya sp. A25]|eukprot:GSA25T00000954001.1
MLPREVAYSAECAGAEGVILVRAPQKRRRRLKTLSGLRAILMQTMSDTIAVKLPRLYPLSSSSCENRNTAADSVSQQNITPPSDAVQPPVSKNKDEPVITSGSRTTALRDGYGVRITTQHALFPHYNKFAECWQRRLFSSRIQPWEGRPNVLLYVLSPTNLVKLAMGTKNPIGQQEPAELQGDAPGESAAACLPRVDMGSDASAILHSSLELSFADRMVLDKYHVEAVARMKALTEAQTSVIGGAVARRHHTEQGQSPGDEPILTQEELTVLALLPSWWGLAMPQGGFSIS